MTDAAPTPDFWRGKYRDNHTPWDLGTVSAPVLTHFIRHFPGAGRVLVPGCGRGYEALFLAERGYAVTAVDVVPEPLAYLRARAEEQGVTLSILQQDMLTLGAEYDGAFDVFLEQTCLCALHPRLWPDYVRLAERVLKPGGQLLGVFMEVPGDDGPPYSTPPAQLQALFAPERWEAHGPEPVQPQNPARPGPEYLARFVKRG